MVSTIARNHGMRAFYNGLSASVLRQATYSTTRFAVYDLGKKFMKRKNKKDMPFVQKILLAGVSGVIGSLVGNLI